jgi:N-acetylneuraminic acid mutarotase
MDLVRYFSTLDAWRRARAKLSTANCKKGQTEHPLAFFFSEGNKKMKFICLLVSCLSFQLVSAGLEWQRKADLLLPVQEIYPVVFRGEIYVAGGLSSELPKTEGQMTAKVQIYNPTTDQWRFGPALPEGRHHGQLVAVADQLYLFGGFVQAKGGNWSASADVLRLDQHQVWTKVATLPAPLSETISWVWADKVHLVSGRAPATTANAQWQDQTDVAIHWVFDVKSLSTTEAAALPEAKNSAAGLQLNGRGYLFGGRQVKGSNSDQVYSFDEKSQLWLTQKAMPQAQAGLAAAALQQHVLLFGGEFFQQGGGVFTKVWSYSPEDNNWQQQGEMPVPRHGLGAVTLNDAVYVIGGATEAGLKQTSAVLEKVSLKQ